MTKKRRSKPKLISNPDMIIDTGKIKHYTPEEAIAEKNARRAKAATDLEKEMSEEEKQAIEEAQGRHDALEKIMKPHADRILAEQDEMINLAMYSIIGDQLGISQELMRAMFGWDIYHKHPETGVINLKKKYKCLVFHGDANHQAFRGKCSGCGVTMTGVEFAEHKSTHVKDVEYKVSDEFKKLREPKMLIWWRYESPLVIYSKTDSEKIIEVKNNWQLLFDPAEYLYPDECEGGE